jgi:hypothetical protein
MYDIHKVDTTSPCVKKSIGGVLIEQGRHRDKGRDRDCRGQRKREGTETGTVRDRDRGQRQAECAETGTVGKGRGRGQRQGHEAETRAGERDRGRREREGQ